jgi:hypothetical protein
MLIAFRFPVYNKTVPEITSYEISSIIKIDYVNQEIKRSSLPADQPDTKKHWFIHYYDDKGNFRDSHSVDYSNWY